MGDFKGFSIEGPPAVSIAINNDDSVDFVEQDQLVTTSSLVTQANPPYGLARISHRKKGTTTFLYDSSAGEGTYAYIIDTVRILTNLPHHVSKLTSGPPGHLPRAL